VYVSSLTGEKATIVVRTWIPGEALAERAASDLRLRVSERLAVEPS
jgi:hypothetical protein